MAQTRKTFGQKQSGLAPSYRSGAYAPAYRAQPASFAPNPTQGYHTQNYSNATAATPAGQTIDTGRSRPVTWRRYLSGLIDFVVLVVLTLFLMLGFDMIDGVSETPKIGADFGLTIAVFALWFLYGLVLETSSWQATIGKKITGIIVTDEYGEPLSFGRGFGRACGKVLSSFVPFYISYTMMHWSKKNKTLHDLMAGTRVYKRSELGGNVGGYFD